ncbi:hypothetical protein E6O75_ATG10819 [Venturia nashicola]|uniref:Uncharacterized protein n=1 Tax=Venturia nashicola TaxID=86259 RepID=A0A4Z1P2E3_9PEZI|nr:hypothetical protein E6O75_ATG10819 [Venturia nashicola]
MVQPAFKPRKQEKPRRCLRHLTGGGGKLVDGSVWTRLVPGRRSSSACATGKPDESKVRRTYPPSLAHTEIKDTIPTSTARTKPVSTGKT